MVDNSRKTDWKRPTGSWQELRYVCHSRFYKRWLKKIKRRAVRREDMNE